MIGVSLTILIALGVISYQNKKHREELSNINKTLADIINSTNCTEGAIEHAWEGIGRIEAKKVRVDTILSNDIPYELQSITEKQEDLKEHVTKATENLFWRVVSTPMKISDK